MTPIERQTLDAMQKYGGSVIKALAAAYVAADSWNRKLIRNTFFAEWQHYQEMAADTEKARAQ